MLNIEAFKNNDPDNIDNKHKKIKKNNFKEIIIIEPENLYKKYININSDYYIDCIKMEKELI